MLTIHITHHKPFPKTFVIPTADRNTPFKFPDTFPWSHLHSCMEHFDHNDVSPCAPVPDRKDQFSCDKIPISENPEGEHVFMRIRKGLLVLGDISLDDFAPLMIL